MAYAFNGTNPNPNWALNRLNRRQSALDAIVSTIRGILGFVTQGGGSYATDGMVENAVQWCIDKVTKSKITYSLEYRNLNNPDGTSYDCSSFLITAFNQAGFNINATYTGNMKDAFVAAGWEWYPVSWYIPADNLVRGDIMLNEVSHTQMYIGNGEDVNCGGTPAEIIPHNSDNWGRGWDGYLHYPSNTGGTTINVPVSVPQSGIIGDYTANYGSIPWAYGTNQRSVFEKWQAAGSASSDGIATLDGRYLIAMTPKFGSAGDKVEVVLVGGTRIPAILADIKGSDAGSEWGHYFGSQVSLVEFEAISTLSTAEIPDAWRYQDVNYVQNLGSIL